MRAGLYYALVSPVMLLVLVLFLVSLVLLPIRRLIQVIESYDSWRWIDRYLEWCEKKSGIKY